MLIPIKNLKIREADSSPLVSDVREIIIPNGLLTDNGSGTVTLNVGSGSGSVTSVAATAPVAGFTISGSPITTSGTFVFALSDDLAGLESLSSNGIPARTATNTWAIRTITGTSNRLTVTNGDGVSGNPTLDISTSYVGQATITTLGTITTGTWNGTTIGVTYGGTGTTTAFTSGSIIFAGSSGVYSQDNSNLFWDDANNRLGIGTASPTQKLHVVGALRIESGNLMINGDYSLIWDGTAYITSGGITDIRLNSGTYGNIMVLNGFSGNVGIGTTLPDAKLQINTVSNSTIGLIIKGAASQAESLQEWRNSSNSIIGKINIDSNVFTLTASGFSINNTNGISCFGSLDNIYATIVGNLGTRTDVSGLRCLSATGGFDISTNFTWSPNASNTATYVLSDLRANLNPGASNSGGNFYGQRVVVTESTTTGLSFRKLFSGGVGSSTSYTERFYVDTTGNIVFQGVATGNGSGLTTLNASNLSSGIVSTSRLGLGTADATTYLAGDSTFKPFPNVNPAGIRCVDLFYNGGNFDLFDFLPGSIDGVTIEEGLRILFKDQTDPAENGIYVSQGTGPYLVVRAEDFDSSSEVLPTSFFFIRSGTTYGGSGWVLTSPGPITIGSTALTFVRFTTTSTTNVLGQYNVNGLLTQTATNVFIGRTITGTSNEVAVTDGNGVSGNPTISLPSLLTFTSKTVTGGTFESPTINVKDNVFTLQDNTDPTKTAQFQLSGISNNTLRTYTFPDSSGTFALTSNLASYQPLDSTLTALATYNTNGIIVQTATDTFTGRTIVGTSNRLVVTNGDGVSGNPTLDISSSYIGQATITTVGTLTSGSTGSGFTIALGSSTITGDLPFANLTQGSALSVLGVAGNSIADVASIAASSDHQVLRRSGTSLAFGAINLASTNAVTGTLSASNVGAAESSGNPQFNNGGILGGLSTSYVYSTTRTLPTSVNDAVDIGSFNDNGSTGAGGISFMINISVSDGGISVTKQYIICSRYTAALPWTLVIPQATSGPYISEDFGLDYKIEGEATSFRIRRISGSTAGTCDITINAFGHGVNFTSSTSVNSVSAPTNFLNNTHIAFQASAYGTTGGIFFGSSSGLAQDASNLFWDDTNNRLGILTATPNSNLHVVSGAASSKVLILQAAASQSTNILELQNNAGSALSYFDASGIFQKNSVVQRTALGVELQPVQITWMSPVNKTIPIISKASVACTINELRGLKTSAGSLTLAIQINGTNVTGLSSISVTTTAQDVTATAANTVAVGDRVTFVVTSASSATDLEFEIKRTV